MFWKQIGGSNRADPDGDHANITADDEREGRPRFFARGYSVFNEAQVEGRRPPELPRLPESERIADADAFFSALKIPIVSSGNEACYRPGIDTIFMPPFEHFVDAASYYSCLGHEAAQATGAKHRLDRDLSGRFGSAKYAMDEVVCELTSSFIMADLGIAHRPCSEHAAYIASWLRVLNDDPRAIFARMGRLVQQPQASRADWPCAAG